MTMCPQKILYVVSSLRSCGPTNQLHYLIEGLDRQKFSPSILTMYPEPVRSEAPKFRQLEVPVRTLGFTKQQLLLRGVSAFRRLVNTDRPVLIHSHGLVPDVLLSLSSLPVAQMTTVRNYPWDDYPMKFGRLRGAVMAWLHIRTLAKISLVVACSEAVQTKLAGHGKPTAVVLNGIDTDFFKPGTEDQRRHARDKLGVDATVRVFVTAGSLIPRKNPLGLIRNFLATKPLSNDRLIILGDGPLRQACAELVKASSRVLLAGDVKDVRPYFWGSDYYLSFSYSEGFPNGVLEAMACGLPVALSAIPPHEEQIGQATDAGVLFDVNDSRDFQGQVGSLLTGDWQKRSQTVCKLAQDLYSAQKMSDGYQKLYETILTDK